MCPNDIEMDGLSMFNRCCPKDLISTSIRPHNFDIVYDGNYIFQYLEKNDAFSWCKNLKEMTFLILGLLFCWSVRDVFNYVYKQI